MGAFLKGTLLGGLAIYFWGFLSWAVLGLHNPAMHGFTNGDAVLTAIA